MKKFNTKSIMKRAHNICSEAVKTFGGKKAEFFSEALKQAWKEAKTPTQKAKAVVNASADAVKIACCVVLGCLLSLFLDSCVMLLVNSIKAGDLIVRCLIAMIQDLLTMPKDLYQAMQPRKLFRAF